MKFPVAVFALLLGGGGALFAQEAKETESAADEAKQEDWLEFYYQSPRPERLVREVKGWAEDGTLQNQNARPVVIAFLAQVFRQNRDRIGGWYQQLSGLSREDRQVIDTALLFSRTGEADDVLRQRYGEKYDEQKRAIPKILEMNLASRNALDMLWGFFYATGSENAIRRIIWSFRFEDAPDNPAFARIPRDHQPLYKVLPEAASWMLRSNLKRHPRVGEILEELYAEEDNLVAVERRWVYGILNGMNPEKYPVKTERAVE